MSDRHRQGQHALHWLGEDVWFPLLRGLPSGEIPALCGLRAFLPAAFLLGFLVERVPVSTEVDESHPLPHTDWSRSP